MKRQWLVLAAILVLGIAAIIQNQSGTGNENSERLPKVGYKVPSLSLRGLDGKMYSVEDLQEKPVILNFWASWCGPCRIEAPELVQLHEKYKDRVEIYAVNLTQGDSVQAAQAFAQEYGFKFPVLLDEGGLAAKEYQVISVPTTYFVNGNGIIVDKVMGLADTVTLENKMKQLIR